MKILGIRTGWNQNAYRRLHDSYGGIDYYRIIKPLEAIGQKTIGKDISKYKDYEDLVKGYDAVLIKPIDNLAAIKLVKACKENGVKLVIDQDDNLFEGRPSQEFYSKMAKGSENRQIAAAFISFADAMICSTEPLKEYYEKWLWDVHKIKIPMYVQPNYNDYKDFDYPFKKNEDKIVIGYPGSNSHNDDLKMVMPALVKILRDNPNVEVELVGSVDEKKEDLVFSSVNRKDTPENKKIFDRIFISPGTFGFDTYPQLLSTKKWDIGIAPLIKDKFNEGKSHIKWMEYAMYKIPCVASKVYPYYKKIDGKDVIKHGKTGYLATNKENWVRYLQKLIDSKELREKIGNNAYEYVKKEWQIPKEKIKKDWEEILKQ